MAHNFHFPLAEIFETQTYPHARTLRTSFFRKLWDSFKALAGNPPKIAYKSHVGVFDFLTLYIPAGLLFLMGWCIMYAGKNFLATLLVIPVILINIPLLIARIAFGAVATILFLPVTGIVHGISRHWAGKNHKEALALRGQLNKGGEQSLGDYLKEQHIDIEELNITIKKTYPKEEESANLGKDNGSSNYQLMFWSKVSSSSDGVGCEECLNGHCSDTHNAPFSVEIRQEGGTVNQATNIHALFKLNVGDVVRNIEKTNIPDKQTILAI